MYIKQHGRLERGPTIPVGPHKLRAFVLFSVSFLRIIKDASFMPIVVLPARRFRAPCRLTGASLA